MNRESTAAAEKLSDEALSRQLGRCQRVEAIFMLLCIASVIACVLVLWVWQKKLLACALLAVGAAGGLIAGAAQRQRRALLDAQLGDFYRAKGYSEAAHNRIQRYEILLEFLQDEKQQDEAFFRQMMVLDLYARENMKTRPHFAKDPSEWKNESRDFYQKEAETRTLLPSYTTYDWKQLQRMTHVEVFDYDVLGNGEKARMVLLFDYQKRDPLTGNAEMIDCSEFFYA